jgi:hypothetical protein
MSASYLAPERHAFNIKQQRSGKVSRHANEERLGR